MVEEAAEKCSRTGSTRRTSFSTGSAWTLFAAGAVCGAVFTMVWIGGGDARAVAAASADTDEFRALRAEVERLASIVPDQAHAMADVGVHFTNLWFAARAKNWPLADFYLAETRSHLKWAVRIRPIRQTKAGDIDLNGILEAIDNSLLAEVKAAVDQQDLKRFESAYRQTIEGCYACHKASEKPFIRPQIPGAADQHIINIEPDVSWPE
ncbi:MAG: hypothetical protein IT365_27145 [Candidatus Hydrogenedentes bacterium]|nr:hypothetical protein [Candidatus Hydrogenedentota bacterium]